MVVLANPVARGAGAARDTQVEAVARMPGSIKRGYLNDIEKVGAPT
ncbi:MAG: hypothetical protein R3B72_51270 [Polyangiaceae bacterium]